MVSVLREGSVVGETGRHLVWLAGEHRHEVPNAAPTSQRDGPVVLVPNSLVGDASLSLLARSLRRRGHRTYRSLVHANVGCTRAAASELEARLEAVAQRRGSRVQVVGHSLGGMLARGLAVRRPDLVAAS